MELEGGSGSVYRLVVRLDDDECVFDAPAFAHYKQARAQIAAAVCRHARHGVIRQVLLQRCDLPRRGVPRPASMRPFNDDDGLPWCVVGRWEDDVIHRILRQNGFVPPAPAGPVGVPPDNETPAASASIAIDPAAPLATPLPHRPGNGVDRRARLEPALALVIAPCAAPPLVAAPATPPDVDAPLPRQHPDTEATSAPPAAEPPPAAAGPSGEDEQAATTPVLAPTAPADEMPAARHGPGTDAAPREQADEVVPRPPVMPPEIAEPATPGPSVQVPPATRRHKATAWQLPLTILLLVIVWLTFAVLQTGGHPLDLLRFAEPPAVGVAEDLRPIGPATAPAMTIPASQSATLPADGR